MRRAFGRRRGRRRAVAVALSSLGWLTAAISPAASASGAATTTSTTTSTLAPSSSGSTTTTAPVAPLSLSCRAPAAPPPTTTSGTSGTSGTRGASGTSGSAASTSTLGAPEQAVTTTSTTLPVASTTLTTGTSGTSGASSSTTSTTTAGAGGVLVGYYLIESNGSVVNGGSAAAFSASKKMVPLVVAGAVVPGDTGYWLLTSRGNLYNFGSAVDYGSPLRTRHLGTYIGITTTPDGKGFLVVTTKGSVEHYGDAPFCGSPVHAKINGHVAGIVDTPDGNGYWVYTSGGQVFAYGDAHSYGSGLGPAHSPVIGMAATPDGHGYWLAYNDGAVRQFGDAAFFGSAAHHHLHSPIAAFAANSQGTGYWLIETNGTMFQYGNAPFYGSLVHHPPKPPVRIATILATAIVEQPSPPSTSSSSTTTTTTLPPLPPLTGDPFAHGAIGYDISNFQCQKPGSSLARSKLPVVSGIAILQVAGWLDTSQNSCLSSEVAWAESAGTGTAGLSLYIFMNSPDNSTSARAQDGAGPAGACALLASTAQPACRAYNYGYNGARNAYSYATAEGARSSLWWLDVEGAALASGDFSNFSAGQYWSANPALNAATIQGAIDALRAEGITVGIYSTNEQYAKITGGYVPTGARVPLWVAGVPWTNPPYNEKGLPSTAALAAWCAGTAHYANSKAGDLFAGGVPWLLQETPGILPSPDGIDPDYAC